MSIVKKLLLLCSLFALTTFANNNVYAMSDWIFNTIPADGNISGKPGDTMGWGYEIKNLDPTNWLIINGLSSNSFQDGMPDDSSFDSPILAPLSSITVPYDGEKGLYKFTWNKSTPEGFVNTGSFTLTAEFWNGDPTGSGKLIGQASDKTANYSVATTKETDDSFIEIAISGDGLTNLAKKALLDYLKKNPATFITNEHGIFIEDYIRKNTFQEETLHIGTSVEFSKDIIQKAITKSEELTNKQLQNLKKYSTNIF